MEERINQLETTLSVLHSEVSQLKELLGSGFKKVESNFELLKNQVNNLNVSVKVLNVRVEALKGTTNEGFEDVGGKIETLTEEISKIGTVTKYDEYFRNLKDIQN